MVIRRAFKNHDTRKLVRFHILVSSLLCSLCEMSYQAKSGQNMRYTKNVSRHNPWHYSALWIVSATNTRHFSPSKILAHLCVCCVLKLPLTLYCLHVVVTTIFNFYFFHLMFLWKCFIFILVLHYKIAFIHNKL